VSLEKHSVTITGHRTSISLEPVFWQELKAAAAERGGSLADLISRIDETRDGNLSSALRVFVVERLQRQRDAVRVD
jgi:predicted DNA-binding ribbon-helix-helix protein